MEMADRRYLLVVFVAFLVLKKLHFEYDKN
jgi:hypothetical protein